MFGSNLNEKVNDNSSKDNTIWVCIDCGDGDVMGVFRSLAKAEQCKEDLAPVYKVRVETSQLDK